MLTNITAELVSQIFPATPISHIAKNLPFVVDALNARQCSYDFLIVALATIRAETENFLPVEEVPSRFNTSPGGAPFDLYQSRASLGNRGAPDGFRFRGRGYIQLTGRYNYDRLGRILNLDLIGNPDSAVQPQIAAAILVEFLVQKRPQIQAALAQDNLAAARKLVNGGSNGLDRFTDAYRRAVPLFPSVS